MKLIIPARNAFLAEVFSFSFSLAERPLFTEKSVLPLWENTCWGWNYKFRTTDKLTLVLCSRYACKHGRVQGLQTPKRNGDSRMLWEDAINLWKVLSSLNS